MAPRKSSNSLAQYRWFLIPLSTFPAPVLLGTQTVKYWSWSHRDCAREVFTGWLGGTHNIFQVPLAGNHPFGPTELQRGLGHTRMRNPVLLSSKQSAPEILFQLCPFTFYAINFPCYFIIIIVL